MVTRIINFLRDRYFLLFIFFFASITKICPQQTDFTKDSMGYEEVVYIKHAIDNIYPGESGKACLWDFSKVNLLRTICNVTETIDSLGRIKVTDDKQITYYIEQEDNLFEIGYEKPLEIVYYSEPIFRMKYPMYVGDSIYSSFEGNGIYCGSQLIKKKGDCKVTADGQGDIVISDSDTIKNVIRYHFLKTYSVTQGANLCNGDSSRDIQLKDEIYEWYVNGYTRPLFEVGTSTSYLNLSPIGTSSYAFCYWPEVLTHDDETNLAEHHPNGDTDESSKNNNDIFQYNILINDHSLIVNYSLEEDATISFILTDNRGMVFEKKQHSLSKGIGYQEAINLPTLHTGIYVLFINVNGSTFCEKVKR